MDKWSFGLLGLEFFLFIIYAFPPFRLKEKGIWGVMTDALYAHVIPALLAAYTFFLIGNRQFQLWKEFILILIVWQISLGIRNILLHQILDFDNDCTSGNKTFVVKYKVQFSENVLKRFLFPIEIISLGFLFYIISTQFLFFTIGYLLFFVYTLLEIFVFKNQNKPQNYRGVYYQFFDNFYLDWFPLLILIALIISDFYFIILFSLHIILFRNIVKGKLINPFIK
jgi:hypothetical protein